jgi:hypothetical protein
VSRFSRLSESGESMCSRLSNEGWSGEPSRKLARPEEREEEDPDFPGIPGVPNMFPLTA